MRQTKIIMGMPITVEIIGKSDPADIGRIFDYFTQVDEQFSPYKKTSELAKLNDGLKKEDWSVDMAEVMELCSQTKDETNGFFNIEFDGRIDTSGLVKGWAIQKAAVKLAAMGYQNFYVEAGGDIQTAGFDQGRNYWKVGIRNPFNIDEIVKTVKLSGNAIATSGAYIRGEHIYNPVTKTISQSVSSLSVISESIYDADRFATAAYAMGKEGIDFINERAGLEGYMVLSNGTAVFTEGFENYVV